MKKVILILISLFILFVQIIYSQLNIDYNYPLKVGNEFSYIKVRRIHELGNSTFDSSFVKYRIIKDSIINNKLYFIFDSLLFNSASNIMRMDSIKGNLLRPHNTNCGNYSNEILIDSLRASLNENIYFCNYLVGICTDTGQVNLFGFPKNSKKFYNDYTTPHYFYSNERGYAQQFGIYYYYFYGASGYGYSYSRYTLKGCVINGITFGDTVSYIGIKLISSEIPTSPSLSQNYPNPFNPVTRIKYDVPSNVKSQKSNVKIIIYDIFGREIETLVNQTQKPGSYEITWNGSRYASGVYFYRLYTDEYAETRKMVLIK